MLAAATLVAAPAGATAGWSTVNTADPTGADRILRAVSCSSTTTCVAVGTYTDTGGNVRTLAERRTGSAFSKQTTNDPTGSNQHLTGVSCVNDTTCTAVGYFTDTGGNVKPLVQQLTLGTNWSRQTVSEPTGTNQRLYGVDCYSATECVAVGEYTDASRQVKPLVLRWDGFGSWSPDGTFDPTGSHHRLHDVSCQSLEDLCFAVGSYLNGSGVVKPLVMSWDGFGSWAAENTVEPTGSDHRLFGVSCPTDEFCAGAGSFTDSVGQVQPLVETWGGFGSWSNESTSGPLGSERRGLAVDCATDTDCLAVGHFTDATPKVSTTAWSWDGLGGWSSESTPNPTLTSDRRLLGVSCPSAASPEICVAVGRRTDDTGAVRTFAVERD